VDINTHKPSTDIVNLEPMVDSERLEEELQLTLAQKQNLAAELNGQREEIKYFQSKINQLRKGKNKYKELFDFSPIGYLVVDAQHVVQDINPAAAALFGRKRAQINNSPFLLYVSPDDRITLRRRLSQVCAGIHSTLRINVYTESFEQRSVILHMHPLMDHSCKTPSCQITMMDVGEHIEVEKQLRKARDYLEHLALHDVLTGLPNRRYFSEALEQLIISSRRKAKKFAIFMLDIDKFKYINDSLGHEAGDELLVELAARLEQCVREQDTVCRLGGDEFTIIATDVDDEGKELTQLGHTIRSAIAAPFKLLDKEVTTTGSIGVCIFPIHSSNAKEITQFADAAMYHAKATGRNTIQTFDEDIRDQIGKQFRFQHDLSLAIKRKEFEVWFQPICNMTERTIVGMEALARWRHPIKGLVPPAEFIRCAEQSGEMEVLGYNLLDMACASMRTLCQRTGNEKILLSVNVSAKQLVSERFPRQVQRILESNNFCPECLEFEVTEGCVFHDDKKSIGVISELRDMGIRFAVDDFGTGYSSFSKLRGLPISKIKIDQSFVHGLPMDADNCAIAKTIVSISNDLNLEVVSEGVETIEQCLHLKSIGCHLMQGNLTGAPKPISQIMNTSKVQSLVCPVA